jgi:hypothetical protein
MATFKVGQRVRVIAHYGDCGDQAPNRGWVGHEGIVIGRRWRGIFSGWSWYLNLGGFRWFFHDAELASLEPPRADEFIEQVKRWKPEPEVVAPAKQRELSK